MRTRYGGSEAVPRTLTAADPRFVVAQSRLEDDPRFKICRPVMPFRATFAEKRFTYPWAKGLKVDDIMAYYDEVKQKDWVHADTGAEVLKAQHPEFEMYS